MSSVPLDCLPEISSTITDSNALSVEMQELQIASFFVGLAIKSLQELAPESLPSQIDNAIYRLANAWRKVDNFLAVERRHGKRKSTVR